VLPQLSRIKGVALSVFFPQKCLGCGVEGELLCNSCQRTLPRINPPLCPKCGKPQPSGILCPACTNWKSDLDGIRSPFKFEGLIREAIHQFKYKNLRSLVEPLSLLLKEYYRDNPIPVQVIVPVPLHNRRLKERGYNQSELLSRWLSIQLGLPVNSQSLIRIKYILPQAKTLSVTERRENVEGSFACARSGIEGKQVLLIDDVSTSGATLDECASALKAAGAKSIWGLALAREL
jgi:ComF family protein